jgi:hypothetical protein
MDAAYLIKLALVIIVLIPGSIYAIAALINLMLSGTRIVHGFVWMPRYLTIGVIWYRAEDGSLSVAINVLPTIQYVLILRKRE